MTRTDWPTRAFSAQHGRDGDRIHDILMNPVHSNLFDNLLCRWAQIVRDYVD